MADGGKKLEQGALFSADVLGRPLPVVGEQKDIRYFGTFARNVLNPPETTQMGFWSINPYVGCAFGCAYCYARYTHRWVARPARDVESRPRGHAGRARRRWFPGWRSSGGSSSSRTRPTSCAARCAMAPSDISRC